jgi:hypothetical protein
MPSSLSPEPICIPQENTQSALTLCPVYHTILLSPDPCYLSPGAKRLCQVHVCGADSRPMESTFTARVRAKKMLTGKMKDVFNVPCAARTIHLNMKYAPTAAAIISLVENNHIHSQKMTVFTTPGKVKICTTADKTENNNQKVGIRLSSGLCLLFFSALSPHPSSFFCKSLLTCGPISV